MILTKGLECLMLKVKSSKHIYIIINEVNQMKSDVDLNTTD